MLIFDILLGKLMFPKLGLPKYPPFLFRFRTPKYQNLGILNSTVCLGSTNNLSLCWGLHGGTRSLVVKKASVSYIVPGCMTLKPRRARYLSL